MAASRRHGQVGEKRLRLAVGQSQGATGAQPDLKASEEAEREPGCHRRLHAMDSLKHSLPARQPPLDALSAFDALFTFAGMFR